MSEEPARREPNGGTYSWLGNPSHKGTLEAFLEGYSEGHARSRDEQSRAEAYAEGYSEGYAESPDAHTRIEAHDEGFSEGFAEGHDEGRKRAAAEISAALECHHISDCGCLPHKVIRRLLSQFNSTRLD